MLSSLHANESGSIAIPFALAAFAVTVAAGGAVDYARVSKAQIELQARVERGPVRLATAGKDHAALGLLGFDRLTVAAKAVAYRPFRPQSEETPGENQLAVCVLALNAKAQGAIDFGGSTTFDGPDCVVHANSSHERALTVRGAASVTARMLCAKGGVSGAVKGAHCKGEVYPEGWSEAVVVPSTCQEVTEVGPHETVTLLPGTYCSTLHIQGTAILEGDYFLKGGIHINSQAHVTGRDVTFHIVDPGRTLAEGDETPFTINGGSWLRLEAPAHGMLIVQHGDAFAGRELRINGNSETRLYGRVYVPKMALHVNGTGGFGQLSRHMMVVADTVRFTGTSRIEASLASFPAGRKPVTIDDPDAVVQEEGHDGAETLASVRLLR